MEQFPHNARLFQCSIVPLFHQSIPTFTTPSSTWTG
jgi:hypothetical protein